MTIKRQTLNADKRKVIADVFQSHFEDNSKYKKQHQDAITNYNLMREQAKVKMNDLVRFHQPQEDVDTIRKMIAKYNSSGGELHHDNCFYVQSLHLVWTKITMVIQKKFMMMFILSLTLIVIFLTSYYRDELNAKGLDADYDVRVDHSGKDKNPTYYKSESNVRSYLGYSSRNDESGNKLYHKDEWENDFKIWVIGTSYCHSRQFQTKDYEWFNKFKSAQENVIHCTQKSICQC